jgi:hypothetical protein
MKNRILNNNSLEFFNASADAVGTLGPNGSNIKLVSNNGVIELGTTAGDVQLGAVGQTVSMKWLGGGTLSSNANSLNVGASGDVVNLNVGGVTYNFPSYIVRNTDYATYSNYGVVRADNTTITISGGVISTNPNYLKTQGTTVAGLVSAVTAGAGSRSFVTDATVTTFGTTVAGGGVNAVPVYSDGTNWRIG